MSERANDAIDAFRYAMTVLERRNSMIINYINTKLKNVELKQNEHDVYFLDLTYEYENDNGFYEMRIPWVHLPICKYRLPSNSFDLCWSGESRQTINLGFGDLELYKDRESNMYFEITEIRKKPRKMTLEEIEKALGYEVELVK